MGRRIADDDLCRKVQKSHDGGAEIPGCAPQGLGGPEGPQSADNQTIEVRRKEAVDLAVMLGSALYNSQVWLREKIVLVNYIDQLAEGAPDMMTCETCHNRYRSVWMDGACPYCAASAGAREQVQSMLEEAYP